MMFGPLSSLVLQFFLRWQLWLYFAIALVFRYARLVINCSVYYFLYRPIPIPSEPTYSPKDVTVIIPTIVESTEELQECVKSAIVQRPSRIILSTDYSREKKIRAMVTALPDNHNIQVTAIPQANKRLQMLQALPLADTTLTLFLDDDVLLPRLFMDWILAPFEDAKVGGAGTNQALKRREDRNFYDFLGDLYLERRNFDCTACNWMDGGLPCLSGRAVMYRSSILKEQRFVDEFGNEMWLGKYTMNVDDDNFVTRWLFQKDWKIQFQNHRECEVLTSLESDSKYIRQCLRWVRSNWRSNLRSMFVEMNVWWKYPYSTYAVFQTTLTHWSFFWDALLLCLFWAALAEEKAVSKNLEHLLVALHVALIWFPARWIKFCRYYRKNPEDIVYVPISIVFGWFHSAFVKSYGLFTINTTCWGTRAGADADNAFRLRRIEEKETPSEKEKLVNF